jgi:hypothetical protein
MNITRNSIGSNNNTINNNSLRLLHETLSSSNTNTTSASVIAHGIVTLTAFQHHQSIAG